MRLVLASLVFQLAGLLAAAEQVVYLSSSGPDRGDLFHEGGTWKLGQRRLSSQELLLARFDRPCNANPQIGVFLRDGSLLCGNLESLKGDEVLVQALTLNTKMKLKATELAGAFYPLPLGQPENLPALGDRRALLAASRALQRDPPFADNLAEDLRPGLRDHVFYRNRDALDGRLVRLAADSALIDLPDGRLAAPRRELLRLVEFQTPPLPPPSDKVRAQGQAIAVGLKPGDVLRGRIMHMDGQFLVLLTSWGGELKIARDTVESLYPTGERGSGWTWLSTLRPARARHTPVFDASFPPRINASCCGHSMRMGGLPCDLGLGVHAQTELAYDLRSLPDRKFVALVGLDDESNGRGDATARVLLDGQEAWTSGPLKPGDLPKHLALDLGKAKELVLMVDYGADGSDSGDHVDWAWAALIGP